MSETRHECMGKKEVAYWRIVHIYTASAQTAIGHKHKLPVLEVRLLQLAQ